MLWLASWLLLPAMQKEMDKIYLEIHKGQRLAILIRYIEGIIKVANIHQPIMNSLLDYLMEMKEILGEAKLADNAEVSK